MSIPFRGAATPDEARLIARALFRPRFYLPVLVWIGLLCLLFGALSFDLETLNGMGWLITGLVTILAGMVVGRGNRRRFARTVELDTVSGFVSAETLRMESGEGAIELPLSKLTISDAEDDVIIVRPAGGHHHWIFRSAFASPEHWREARTLLERDHGLPPT